MLAFTQHTFPKYEAADHHRLIARKLEEVERGEIDRLLITMPPRHGKSELASRRFPAWFMGRNPEKDIIAASYNLDLGTDFGRDVRNIMNDPSYNGVFPGVGLRPDDRAAGRFSTPQGGRYNAAGVGTAVTGRGAHIMLIDDPLKDREEAESESRRQKVWDWFTSTSYTRLEKGGAIIVIQTRWHEDDLAGRLLNPKDSRADVYEHLDLPAIKDGRALWPDKYDFDALERIRVNIGPRDWSALYQQRPSPEDGDFFRRDWFELYDKLPDRLRCYGSSDYAVSEGKGDYTWLLIWGICPDGDLWLVDGWKGQSASDAWVERQIDLSIQYRPYAWFGEAGVIQKAMEPTLKRRMRERRANVRLEWLPSIHDKPTRARGLQAYASMGRVHLPDNELGQSLLAEMLKFPNGKHDDGVDTAANMARAVDGAHPAVRSVVTPKRPSRKDYVNRQQESVGWR